jgi:hypothetical protein
MMISHGIRHNPGSQGVGLAFKVIEFGLVQEISGFLTVFASPPQIPAHFGQSLGRAE